MPVTNEDEEKGNRQGVNILPHYRRTFGLPMMRVMSPEAAEKENRRKSLEEGNLSLADLSKRVAEREEAERRKSPEERRNEAQVEKMLSVGRDLCVKFRSKPQHSNLSWRQLQASLKEFSDVKLGILSIAFLGLPEYSRKILSHKYAIGFFRFKPKNEPKFSSTELSQALKKLKLNIVCILAYKDDAKSKIGKVPETVGVGDGSPPQKEGNLGEAGGNLPPAPPETEVAQDVLINVPDEAEDGTAKDIITPDTQDTPVHPEYAERLTRRIPPARYLRERPSSSFSDRQPSDREEVKVNSNCPEERDPMTTNIDPEIPVELVIFLESVESADLKNEETVRGLLCQISLKALKRDLGFEMSINQLLPFFLVDHYDYYLTESQIRSFLIFFGRSGLSVAKLAPHLKNTDPAKVFYQKTAAIKKLQKFSHAEIGTKKLKTLSQLLCNSALVQKLRTLDIQETGALLKLTSAQLIEKLLSVKKPFQHMSVQTIGRKLCDNDLSLADGPEATQSLINYEQPEDAPGPNSSAAAKAKPEAQVAAAADPPTDDPAPTTFEMAMQEIGRALDMLRKKLPTLRHLTIGATFEDPKGKGHRINVTEMNLPPAE